MESNRKNLKITNRYLWFNVLILILDTFLLSTIYIGITLVDILETKPTYLIVPLIILSLLLPIISFLFIRIDNKINANQLPKFRIISNKIFIMVTLIFEILAVLILLFTMINY